MGWGWQRPPFPVLCLKFKVQRSLDKRVSFYFCSSWIAIPTSKDCITASHEAMQGFPPSSRGPNNKVRATLGVCIGVPLFMGTTIQSFPLRLFCRLPLKELRRYPLCLTYLGTVKCGHIPKPISLNSPINRVQKDLDPWHSLKGFIQVCRASAKDVCLGLGV